MIRVLFVCLGNICRSPMAEAVFQKLVNEAGLSDQIGVDSAGTGSWHVGEKAHPGTQRILEKHGIGYNGRSRQIRSQDIQPDTYLIVMDQSNYDEIRRRHGDQPHLHRLLDFAGQTDVRDVPDPYYTNNFEYVYQLVSDGCQGLLETIREQERL